MLDQYPQITKAILRSLACRVAHLVSVVKDLSLRLVEARLSRHLVEEAESATTIHRQRWATQAEIAARLAMVQDVLNRAMRQLENEGLIRVERHQIHILDREALRKKAALTN